MRKYLLCDIFFHCWSVICTLSSRSSRDAGRRNVLENKVIHMSPRIRKKNLVMSIISIGGSFAVISAVAYAVADQSCRGLYLDRELSIRLASCQFLQFLVKNPSAQQPGYTYTTLYSIELSSAIYVPLVRRLRT
ncbi:hypothetical protein BR93DRAFT_696521 [Coniochaeta sp. PMI_546]|nr:hypothetical protein BR93DRAFT_696521 [Coniochaeta sp. PMI_546]